MLARDDSYWPEVQAHLPSHKLTTTFGGTTRCESVSHGLTALKNKAHPSDWVLVHDGVRPYLREADLLHLIAQVGDHPIGGILGVPVRDTLKRVDEQGTIVETLPRENLWQALTPQLFRYELLFRAFETSRAHHITVTDESAAIERLGHRPLIVPGAWENIKITYPGDME